MKGPWGRVIALVAGLALLGELLVLRLAVPPEQLVPGPDPVGQGLAAQGPIRVLAVPLFQGYLVPFEIASLMLLAAIVGAVVLAKRRV
jgi:NADH-quinone oxidoreductase subunit J